MLERKYIKLKGIIAEARTMHDWARMADARYNLEQVKEELGI